MQPSAAGRPDEPTVFYDPAQVDGRTSAAVQAWLAARTEQFRAGAQVVVIDPHAGYAAGFGSSPPAPALGVHALKTTRRG